MKRKYAIFNKSSTDNFANGHMTLPVDSFTGAFPTSDTQLSLFFTPFIGSGVNSGEDNVEVRLTISANRHKSVLESIVKEFSTGENYLITIVDVEAGIFVSEFISNVESFTGSNTFSWDAGHNGSRTRIKILPRDFIADDGGRPVMIDDTGSDRWIESDGTKPMYASVAIPMGFQATNICIYGSATSAITVYEADINSKTVTSKGTGNIGTAIDITDVIADSTNYLLIEMAQASGEEVYGGYVDIAIV
tara:strand:- start:3841 stop:4584 length:744 start_codon:yes stop_codon:yes gene_type:complete